MLTLEPAAVSWDDEGLQLGAEDFDLTALGEIERIENNPNVPGRADITIVGGCRLPKGSKLQLKGRPKPHPMNYEPVVLV